MLRRVKSQERLKLRWKCNIKSFFNLLCRLKILNIQLTYVIIDKFIILMRVIKFVIIKD